MQVLKAGAVYFLLMFGVGDYTPLLLFLEAIIFDKGERLA
jgi:hypothetical protein